MSAELPEWCLLEGGEGQGVDGEGEEPGSEGSRQDGGQKKRRRELQKEVRAVAVCSVALFIAVFLDLRTRRLQCLWLV